ncbi:MAG: TetR/AcrR family transcriptional regulator, partial [Marmoricola sp.]
MNSSTARKRPYDVSRRSEQSRLTRLRVLEAARELLLTEGYLAMTVPGLAKRAGVSPQTVYNLIGGKAEVVKAVYDDTIAGDDDPTPLSERPAFRAVLDAEDIRAYAVAYAAWCRERLDRVGPLLAAIIARGAGADPTVADFIATTEAERRRGNANGLRGLADRD